MLLPSFVLILLTSITELQSTPTAEIALKIGCLRSRIAASSLKITHKHPNPEEEDIQALAMKELQEAANKEIVLRFYREAVPNKDVEALKKYLDADNYIQHAPYVADGREAIIQVFKTLPHYPDMITEIHHIGADGDLVYVHARTGVPKEGINFTLVDIYKVKNQKIVEHWDVVQNYKLFANDHPFF